MIGIDPKRRLLGPLLIGFLGFPPAALADDAITVINAEDGTRTTDAGNPDGVGLYCMDELGGPCVRLCRTPTSFTGSPSLSHDGTKVAFDGWRSHLGEGIPDCRMYTFEVSDPTTITDIGIGMMPSWGPGGVGLAYSDNRGGRVGVMDASGAGRSFLARRGWSAEWSPDGQKIAYTSRVNAPDVIVYDLLTEQREILFQDLDLQSIVSGITWSPDSQRVCGLANGIDGRTMLVVGALGGETPSKVISKRVPDSLMRAIDKPIAWGGDGSRVIFPAADPEVGIGQLFTIEVSGEAAPELAPGLPEEAHCTQPFWSPNGAILFVGMPIGGANDVDE